MLVVVQHIGHRVSSLQRTWEVGEDDACSINHRFEAAAVLGKNTANPPWKRERPGDEKKHTAEIDPIKFDLDAPYPAMPADFQLRVFCTFEDPQGKKHDAWGHRVPGLRFSSAA